MGLLTVACERLRRHIFIISNVRIMRQAMFGFCFFFNERKSHKGKSFFIYIHEYIYIYNIQYDVM